MEPGEEVVSRTGITSATPRNSRRDRGEGANRDFSIEIPATPRSQDSDTDSRVDESDPLYSPGGLDFRSPSSRERRRKSRERSLLHSALKHAPFLKSPVTLFLAAQLLIVWFVASAVLYVHDFTKVDQHSQGGGGKTLLGHLGRHLGVGCHLRPPVCKYHLGGTPDGAFIYNRNLTEMSDGYHQEASVEEEKLPWVFFFAGIEGSGHKFFEQVFRNLPDVNFSVVQFEPGLHLTSEPNQTHVVGKVMPEECPKLPYARPLREYAQEMSKRLAEVGPGPYLRARDSYPLGRVRTPLARPDLVSMLQLDGLLFRLKVVVLLRDLSDAVRSAYRMGYHGGDVGLQVRIVEDSMMFLDATTRMLPCSRYLILDFDWAAEEPELIAGPLADFIDMGHTGEDVVKAIIGASRSRPAHNATYPGFGSQKLEEFFALRTDMWPLLAAVKERQPFFWPHQPNDWPAEPEEDLDKSKRSGYLYDYEE